jgi:hypothetical protein
MTIKGLSNGISSLILLSTFSCAWEQLEPRVDCTTSPVVIELLDSEGAGCGASNGSFTINATGGEGPYRYTSDLENNSDGVFENISAGSYSITATDVKGCSVESNVSIENLEGVNLGDVVITDSGCGSSVGVIKISVSGGEEPYIFSLDGGSGQQNNVFSGLTPGSYDISVTDQLGCEITTNADITSGVSYATSIKGIIETNCAISGCHNGSQSPNLSSFGSIQSSASRIKARTANASMPRGRTLSQTQIELIACWVDDGALNN